MADNYGWSPSWTPSAPVSSGGGGRANTPTSSPPATEQTPWAPGSTGRWNPESESPYKSGTAAYTGGWGSFGTKDAWQQAFFSEHGRAPGAQDEADYWDSQIYAVATGNAPTPAQWQNRYWGGDWNSSNRFWVKDNYGNSYMVPANNGATRSPDMELLLSQGMAGDEPEQFQIVVNQMLGWANSLGSDAPEWIANTRATRTTETTQAAEQPVPQTTEKVAEQPVVQAEQAPALGQNVPSTVPVLQQAPGAVVNAVRNTSLDDWLKPANWINAARSSFGSGLTVPEYVQRSAQGWGSVLGVNTEKEKQRSPEFSPQRVKPY